MVRKFFQRRSQITKWNDNYVLSKESYFWVCWGMSKAVILSFLIPFAVLKGLFDFGLLQELAHSPIPDWFTMFFIGLFGSWIMISFKITEKILIRFRIIIPTINDKTPKESIK